jgi:hypothetical protein
MSDVPSQYRDYPRPYRGQPRRPYGDQFSTFRDLSNPNDVGTDRTPGDTLNPDKPTGMTDSDKPTSEKPKSIRWRGKKDANAGNK